MHRIVFAAAILVQLDIEFQQLFGSAESLDTKIVNPGIDLWTEQLGFDDVDRLMMKAIKPTVIVPSHITFYPIRVSDNILHQAARLFNRGINKRFAEELIVEGNLLFKDTDMDIRFSRPIIAGDYWRWWEKRMLPGVVNRFESLNELFELKPQAGHWRGRVHAIGMKVM